MVVRRTRYPQVDPRAEGLMTTAVAEVPRGAPIAEAARVAAERGAQLLLSPTGRGWGGVRPATLAHALALGLGPQPLRCVLWVAPAVDPRTPEVAVRRRLGPATPFLAVVRGGRVLGAVLREDGGPPSLAGSLADRLGALDAETGGLLALAGKLAGARGWPVALVGGTVRDLVRGTAAAGDLDLAVEGDAPELARRLAEAVGGEVVAHAAFGTASVALRDGRRLDLATARRERYPRPGALPEVAPASLLEDLGRRDFSVNALAVRLDGPAWGALVDPLGGLADLARRRVRILHPLSFVEDPTRIFRAGRFACRLGFGIERSTRALLAAAARLPVYEALSGERLRAELERICAEAAPAEVFRRLGRAGAFRLLDPRCGFPAVAAARLRAVAAWVRRLDGRGEPVLGAPTVLGLYLLALTAHLGAAAAVWERLALPPPRLAELRQACAEGPRLAAALNGAADAEAAYRLLRPRPEVVAAWAGVLAGRRRAAGFVREHFRRWRRLSPLLSGEDLKGMGLQPGPRMGELLEGLVAAQAAGRVRSRASARRWVARALLGAGGGARAPTRPASGRDAGGSGAGHHTRGGGAWRPSTCS